MNYGTQCQCGMFGVRLPVAASDQTTFKLFIVHIF